MNKSKYEKVKLSHICKQVTDGTHFTPSYVSEGIKFLSVLNVRENCIDFDNTKYISEEEHKRLIKRCYPKPYDILLTKIGTVGLAAVIPEVEFEFSIFVSVALIKIKEGMNPYYMMAYLNSRFAKFQIERALKGIGVPDLHLENIRDMKVVKPCQNIQEQIADLYCKAYEHMFSRLQEAKELMNGIDVYIQNILGITLRSSIPTKKTFYVRYNKLINRHDPLYYSKDLFRFLIGIPYQVMPIYKVVRYMKTGFAAGKDNQDGTGNGVIQIRPTNIDDDRNLIFDKNVYIDSDDILSRHGDILLRGEVLYNNTNSQELVGKTTYFNLEGDYFCSNHITRIGVDSSMIEPEYLCLILNLYQRNKIFYYLCTNWNNQSGVNVGLLRKIEIPVPELNIQRNIIAEVNNRKLHATQLRQDAVQGLEAAKAEVERMILGEKIYEVTRNF